MPCIARATRKGLATRRRSGVASLPEPSIEPPKKHKYKNESKNESPAIKKHNKINHLQTQNESKIAHFAPPAKNSQNTPKAKKTTKTQKKPYLSTLSVSGNLKSITLKKPLKNKHLNEMSSLSVSGFWNRNRQKWQYVNKNMIKMT